MVSTKFTPTSANSDQRWPEFGHNWATQRSGSMIILEGFLNKVVEARPKLGFCREAVFLPAMVAASRLLRGNRL